ncbi:MFS transporter [Bacteroidota bacterium]
MHDEKSERLLKRSALLVATIASFLTPFLGAALNVALPEIGKELKADAILLNLTATSYLLASALFILPFGRYADLVGRKRVFASGLIVFALASAGCALSPSINWLIISRIIQGLGSAMIFGTGIAIISSVFPKGERGKALGINVASVYTGLSLGPFLGGFITQYAGWRFLFWLLLPVAAISLIVLRLRLKGEWAGPRMDPFDFKGSILYMLSLLLLMGGLYFVPKPIAYPLLVLSGIVLILFIRYEQKVTAPLLDIQLFRKNRTFAFSNLAALINYSATFGVGFLLSFYFQYAKGMDPSGAGLILVIQPVIMAVFSPVTGRLSDSIDPKILASWGMGLTTLGLVLLSFAGQQTSLIYFFIVLIINGLGFALFSSPNTNAIMGSVEAKAYGVASGSVGTMRLIGQMLSMGIVLILFSLFIGNADIQVENIASFLQSMRIAFILFAILCFGGILASLSR